MHLSWRNWAHAAGLEKKHNALNKREAMKRTHEQACMQGSADAGARAHQVREGLPTQAHPDHTPL